MERGIPERQRQGQLEAALAESGEGLGSGDENGRNNSILMAPTTHSLSKALKAVTLFQCHEKTEVSAFIRHMY